MSKGILCAENEQRIAMTRICALLSSLDRDEHLYQNENNKNSQNDASLKGISAQPKQKNMWKQLKKMLCWN